MIEMLGVLAIIGVLSAGGIWGYTMAIETHKTNAFINEIDNWLMKSKNVFPKNPKEEIVLRKAKQLCTLGIISADLCKTAATNYACFASPFTKGSGAPHADHFYFYLFLRPTGNFASMEFYDLPVRACVKMVTRNWGGPAKYSRNNAPASGADLPLTNVAAETLCKAIKANRDTKEANDRLSIAVFF